MPLKVNVGLSKKIGLPRYGSLGAACHVELELASELLVSDPAAFQRHVRNAYLSCRQAIDDELSRHAPGAPRADSDRRGKIGVAGQVGSAGHDDQDPRYPVAVARQQSDEASAGADFDSETTISQTASDENGAGNHLASPKQHAYIRRLASQIRGLGIRRLEAVTLRMFGKPMAALGSFDASSLIDALKAVKAGEIDVEAALGRVAA